MHDVPRTRWGPNKSGRGRPGSCKNSTNQLDPDIVAAIRQVVREQLGDLNAKVDGIIVRLDSMSTKLKELENGVQDISEKVVTIKNDFLPKLSNKVCNIATALSMKILTRTCMIENGL